MTVRLYFEDPTCIHFSARVVERIEWGERIALVLDRTAFYPTGGGQPHDTGTLNQVPVQEVLEREDDGAVLHLLAGSLEADRVEGRVDWDRRFDLMQQHTGQHILSAAFLEQLEANTVGFHLSGDYATIDLDRAPLSPDQLAAVEDRANEIVFQDRKVLARFVADQEVANLPLRKPLAHQGPVRVVDIPGFDCSACGGTHVRATGEIGLIKITRSERRGQETRVEFLCGRRALADYRAKNSLILDLAREYTVGHWEVADAARRQAADLADAQRQLRRMRDALLDAEAAALRHGATPVGEVQVVHSLLPDRSAQDLKHLALRLAAYPRTVALLAGGGGAGQQGFFAFARSSDLEGSGPAGGASMGALIHQACQIIGGRGGGRPDFAQGGGPQGERVAHALDRALRTLTVSLAGPDL